jgi:tetratricopeptide (TPR) repeat protein
MMNQSEALRLTEAYQQFEAGECIKAVKGLREFADRVDDPWTKAELLYHQVVFLAQMDDAVQARSCFNELTTAVGLVLPEAVPDTSDDTPSANLAVMVRYAELKTLLAERKQVQALQVLEDLVSRYPAQLSGPASEILNDIDLNHGFLLADAARWTEAKPFLERAHPPEVWKSVVCYYLGHAYFESREYERAKEKLMEALHLGLSGHWEGTAHYVLGLVEYHLGEMRAAKEQLELCVKTADPRYLGASRIWEWLETVSRALGLKADADKYRRLHVASQTNSKPH